jgi:hypothetical protein
MDKNIVIISVINAVLTLGCFGIQAIGIKKGKYDSSLASWIIWSCIFSFMFVIYLTEKGWTTISYLLAIQAIGHIIMLGVTYAYSEKNISTDDRKLLWVSGGGFMFWVVSMVVSSVCQIDIIIPTLIGIIGQIIADASASIPYIGFIRKNPERQPIVAWMLNTFIYPLTMFGTWLGGESWTAYIFLTYGLVLYGGMMVVLLIKKLKVG